MIPVSEVITITVYALTNGLWYVAHARGNTLFNTSAVFNTELEANSYAKMLLDRIGK